MEINHQQDFSAIMKCIDILSSSSEEDDEEFLQVVALIKREKKSRN